MCVRACTADQICVCVCVCCGCTYARTSSSCWARRSTHVIMCTNMAGFSDAAYNPSRFLATNQQGGDCLQWHACRSLTLKRPLPLPSSSLAHACTVWTSTLLPARVSFLGSNIPVPRDQGAQMSFRSTRTSCCVVSGSPSHTHSCEFDLHTLMQCRTVDM